MEKEEIIKYLILKGLKPAFPDITEGDLEAECINNVGMAIFDAAIEMAAEEGKALYDAYPLIDKQSILQLKFKK